MDPSLTVVGIAFEGSRWAAIVEQAPFKFPKVERDEAP